jgi:predicted amidohydrolase
MSSGSGPSPLHVALVQVASSRVPAENLERLETLDVAPADLVVLPEVFQRDLGRPDDPLGPDAEPLDGPFVSALVRRAGRHGGTWVAGMVERSEDGDRPFNTLVVVDGSGLRASYRKIHLYDSFGFRESDRLVAGSRVPRLVEVDGWRLGLMTCYDLRFPELTRELSRAGADAVVGPSAWVAGDRKLAHWRTLVTARAVENVGYVVAVGQSAPRYAGHSLVVDPRGEVVVEAGDDDDVLYAELDPALLTDARRENPSLLNRRDDLPWPQPEMAHADTGTDARVTARQG